MAKPVFPSTRSERAHAYLVAMEEVRSRFEILDHALSLDTKYDHQLIREICYLQFRHICELVAIGCLAAEGDFAAHKAFREDYKPGVVFRHLEKFVNVDPPDSVINFSPRPVVRTIEDGVVKYDLDGKPNAITRKELESLWARSGDFLHRLNTSKYFISKPVSENIIPELAGITARLKDLLSNHCVYVPDPKSILMVVLYQPDCRVLAQYFGVTGTNEMPLEEFRLK